MNIFLIWHKTRILQIKKQWCKMPSSEHKGGYTNGMVFGKANGKETGSKIVAQTQNEKGWSTTV
jgi:hypothetical protein